jgi:tripartite-type tricarboxylate transporter receptor subunit TctC
VPDVPTISEAGLPGYHAVAWSAIVAPGKTPPEVVHKLHIELTEILKSSEFREALAKSGSIALDIPTIEGMREFFRSEIVKWGEIVQDAGLARRQ